MLLYDVQYTGNSCDIEVTGEFLRTHVSSGDVVAAQVLNAGVHRDLTRGEIESLCEAGVLP